MAGLNTRCVTAWTGEMPPPPPEEEVIPEGFVLSGMDPDEEWTDVEADEEEP